MLNSGIHYRSIYYKNPPDFRRLSNFDHRLIPYFLSENSRSLNFKDAETLIALSRALLARDFGIIDWRCPSNRLCPTITSRLNYILHVQDLLASFNTTFIFDKPIGIDIGTGASCILAILGAKACGFRTIATEIDLESFESAKENVNRNKLSNDIEFSLSNNCPMKMSYDLGDNSLLQFFMAPKMND